MIETDAARDRIAFLKRLRAVRNFRPEPVPDGVVDDLLEVARWSGSAKNAQPWDFVVIRARQTLGALAAVEGYAKHLEGAPLGIVLVMAGDPSQVAQETYDEGRLSERIMLAAAAHGIGSSIGWFAGGGMAAAKQILGIPQQRLVRTVLSLGYTDEVAHRARPKRDQARKPRSELVHQERYG
jgi:nitroreductase